MIQAIISSFIYCVVALAVPALFIFVICQLSNNTMQLLVNTFGFRSQVYLGCCGIVLHELSHLIVAIIAGHRIDEACLIRFPKGPNDPDQTLGHIYHSWSSQSVAQTSMIPLISVAPVYGCTIVLMLLFNMLAPGFLKACTTAVGLLIDSNGVVQPNEILPALMAFGDNMTFKSTSILAIVAILIVSFSICLGGLALSPEDISHVPKNLKNLIILLVLIVSVCLLFGLQKGVNYCLWYFLLSTGLIFTFSIICIGIVNMIVRLCYLLKFR